MKYFFALAAFLLSFSAYAQNETISVPKGSPPPEARAFEGDRTSLGGDGATAAHGEKMRQPNVEIWLPPQFQASEEAWPILVFSHGFGECARQSSFLTSYLADQGYIVVAPSHRDENCRGGFGGGALSSMRSAEKDWPERSFKKPEAWNDKTESDRKEDVLFAVSSMLDDRQYAKYVDTKRMGLIGYSLGGYTVLGVAGAWPSWKDGRFKAVLALSPYVAPYMVQHTLKYIDIPVMYQAGTRDGEATPYLKRKGGAYDQTKASKYFMELDGAGRFAWTDQETDYQDLIKKTALAFFDTYVRGAPSPIISEGRHKQVKTFWKGEGKK